MGSKKILKMSYNTVTLSCTLACLLLVSLPPTLLAQIGDNNMEIRHERYITVPALGRTFGLGDIYDERNSQFRPISVYTDVIPEYLIRKTEVHKNTMKSAVPLPTKFKDKFSLLGINERDTAVNVLAGLIEVDGSADVILNLNGQVDMEIEETDTGTETETGSGTEPETETDTGETGPGMGIFLIKYQTVVQDLPIFFKEIIPHYNSDILNHRGATHVVTRITWGFNIAVLFKCKPSSSVRVESYLRREFQNLQDGKPAFENSNNGNNISCSVSLSDGLSLPASINITQKDIQAILDKLPQFIRDIQTNGRKGVPLEYGLTPLSLLKRNLIIDPEPNILSQKIPGRYLENIPAIFDTILNSEHKLKTLQEKLYSSILTVGYCIDPNIILKLDTFLQTFLNFKSSLIMELQETLIAVRSSNVSGNIATGATATALFNFTSYYSSDEFEFSHYNVTNFISEFKGALEKIQFCRRLVRNYGDIKYFGARDRNLNSINQNFQAQDKIASYILFIKSEFFTRDSENTEESLNTFLGKLYEPSHSLSVVDCDFEFKECASVNGTIITGTFTIRNVDDTNASGQDQNTTLQDNKEPGVDYPVEVEVLGKPTDYVVTTIKEEAFADLQKEIEELKKVLNLTLQNMETMQSVIDNITRTAGNNTNNIDTLSLHINLMDHETRKDIDYIRLEVIEGCCTAQSDFETLLSGMNDTILDNKKEIDLLRSELAAANEVQKQKQQPEITTTEIPPLLVNKSLNKVHHHTESPVTQVRSVNQTVADGDIQLDCGGMIQIPGLPYPGGSLIVEYKSTTTYENNERCLWTLDSSNSEGLRYNVRLHITLLSDGFADAEDELSAIAWINWEYLTTYKIAKIKPVYRSKFKDFQYLSFTSNAGATGTGFRAKIEVIGVQNKLSGYNWAYTSAVGTATYVPNRGNDRIAVVVNPPGKPVGQAYTLSVDYVEPRRSSYCNGNSTLYLFEIGEKGSSSLLASLCGISSPVTYTSRNPILAAYVTDSQPSGRGFKLSWR